MQDVRLPLGKTRAVTCKPCIRQTRADEGREQVRGILAIRTDRERIYESASTLLGIECRAEVRDGFETLTAVP